MFKKIITVLTLSSFLAPLYCMERSSSDSYTSESKGVQSIKHSLKEIMAVLSTLPTKGPFFAKHKEVRQCFHEEKSVGSLVALEQLLLKEEAKKILQSHLTKLNKVLLDSFLLGAARADCPELIKMLIAAGAQVNARDEESGYTAVMDAAKYSSLKALEVLINAGADVNSASPDGTTALILASNRYKDVLALVNLLIQAKANVNALKVAGSEFNALILAVTCNRLDVADALLKAGANPYFETSKGMTPLLIATMNANLPMIQNLINTPTNTPVEIQFKHIKAALKYAQDNFVASKYILDNFAIRTNQQDIVKALEEALLKLTRI